MLQIFPQEEAGISANSVITHFDGIRVTGCSNLENRLQYYAAGETVEITVQIAEGSEYTEKTFSITLGSKSDHEKTNDQGGIGFGNFEWH
ncbi:PDZ domain-containing protein [Eubacterium ruminantium]|nr:PDZ domain-containing protein [Eubacterium ruminantium]